MQASAGCERRRAVRAQLRRPPGPRRRYRGLDRTAPGIARHPPRRSDRRRERGRRRGRLPRRRDRRPPIRPSRCARQRRLRTVLAEAQTASAAPVPRLPQARPLGFARFRSRRRARAPGWESKDGLSCANYTIPPRVLQTGYPAEYSDRNGKESNIRRCRRRATPTDRRRNGSRDSSPAAPRRGPGPGRSAHDYRTPRLSRDRATDVRGAFGPRAGYGSAYGHEHGPVLAPERRPRSGGRARASPSHGDVR